MANDTRSKRRWRKNIPARIGNWFEEGNKLENDRWADFSSRDMGRQAKISHQKAYEEVPIRVAEMTGRTVEEVRAVWRDRSKRHHATQLVIFVVQQLRRKEWKLKRIASLVRLSPGAVRKYIDSPCVELPANTAGREVSEEFRKVLAEELGIGINADSTTYKLNEVSPAAGDDEGFKEAYRNDLEADRAEQDTTVPTATEITPPANVEPLERKAATAESYGVSRISTATDLSIQPSGAPAEKFKMPAAPRANVSRTPMNTDTGQPWSNSNGSDAELPKPAEIYIVQQLTNKGRNIDEILSEEILNLAEAQVLKCREHPSIEWTDDLADPIYQRIINERQLWLQESDSSEEEFKHFNGLS